MSESSPRSKRENGPSDGVGKFPKRLIVPVRATGKVVQSLETKNEGWDAWIRIAPLVPDVSGQVELTRLERTIQRKIGYLAEVCHRPRVQLRLVDERVPVSMARRVPPKAYQRLASHPEEWQYRTLTRVVPREVLTLLPEDDPDIYENRVATRLVDHLRRYLRRRIQVLTDLARLAGTAAALQQGLETGAWTARHRASLLMGDLFERSAMAEQLRQTLDTLNHLDRTLRALQDSRLYRAVSRAPLPATLTMTNILSNDQYYRQVAFLWRSWVRHGRRKASERSDVELWGHFRRFATLVVLRALELFHLEPDEDARTLAIQSGARLRLTGTLGTFELTIRDDARLKLEAPDLPEALWIALGPPLEGHAVPDRSRGRVLRLRPPVRGEAQAGDGRVAGDASLATGVPVSPVDLGSVERVMRHIQQWFLEQRYLAYPSRLSVPPSVPETLVEVLANRDWIRVEPGEPAGTGTENGHSRENGNGKKNGNGRRAVRRGSRLKGGARKVDGSPPPPSRDLVVRAIPRNGKDAGMGAAMVELRKRHKRLPARERAKVPETLLEEWNGGVRDALERLERIRVCPVCQGRGVFKARDGETFVCVCENCKWQWELRTCGDCGHRFPVLSSKAAPVEVSGDILAAEFPSKDVLAEPGEDGGWRCPRCTPLPSRDRPASARP